MCMCVHPHVNTRFPGHTHGALAADECLTGFHRIATMTSFHELEIIYFDDRTLENVT